MDFVNACTCGFEESCYYEYYPTLMSIREAVPSVSGHKARNVRQKQKIEHCPHCGAPVDDTTVCGICGLPVQPEEIASRYCLFFSAFLRSSVSYSHKKLLPLAENMMRYFEYIEKGRLAIDGISLVQTPREYAQTFQDIADGKLVALDVTEREAFRLMAADAFHLLNVGFCPGMALCNDPDYRFQSEVMWHRLQDPEETNLPPAPVVFDIKHYLRLTNTLLFLMAEEAFLKKEYDKARVCYTCALNQGNVYAATRLGIMNYYGYGCEIDRDAAYEMFNRVEMNCPLARAWSQERFWDGPSDVPRVNVQRSRGGDWSYSDPHADLLEIVRKQVGFELQHLNGSLRELCDIGDWAALCYWGFNVLTGRGVNKDEAQGFRLLSRAMDQGDPYASVLVAECYYRGRGVDRDYEKAYKMLVKYALSHFRKARYLLGCCYYYGEGTEESASRAFSHFRAAAKLGHGFSMLLLADCYRYGYGTDANDEDARYWYRYAVELYGIPEAAAQLADMCYYGIGGKAKPDDAMQYYVYAANNGVAQAQQTLATFYKLGNNIIQDRDAAQLWMERAAAQGDPEHQWMMGMYCNDGSKYHSDRLAYHWFLQSAQQNYPRGQYCVGVCYQKGTHVRQDYAEANRWFTLALEGGHKLAALELGLNYLNGWGAVPDYTKAVRYLTEAADAGIHTARLELCRQFIQRKENLEAAYGWLEKELSDSKVETKIRAEAMYLQSLCLKNGYGVSKDRKAAKKLHDMAIQNGFVEPEKPKGLRAIFSQNGV